MVSVQKYPLINLASEILMLKILWSNSENQNQDRRASVICVHGTEELTSLAFETLKLLTTGEY